MIRNLKALMLAAMALAVFGALAASSAQAAPEFHSELTETTIKISTDGTGKTAHQVLDAPGGATATCAGVSGDTVTTAKTVASIATSLTFEQSCTFLGQPATISTAGCTFTFNASGSVVIAGCSPSVTIPGCVVTVSPGTYGGITYHDINALPNPESPTETPPTTYTTVSAAVTGIHGFETGAGCPVPGTFTTGQYTTGNAIVEGQVKGGGAMTKVWWA